MIKKTHGHKGPGNKNEVKNIHHSAGKVDFIALIKKTFDLLSKNWFYLIISGFLDLLFLVIFGMVYGALSQKILEQAYALGANLNSSALSIGSAIDFSYLFKISFLLFILLFVLFLVWNVIQAPNFRLAKSIVDDKKYDRKDYLWKFSRKNISIFVIFGFWWFLTYFYEYAKLKQSAYVAIFLLLVSTVILLLLIYRAIISYYFALDEKGKSTRFFKGDFSRFFGVFLLVAALFLLVDFLSGKVAYLFWFIKIPQVLYVISIVINAAVLLPLLAYIRLYFFGAIKESEDSKGIARKDK